jgi:hypothetical protein
MLGTAGRLAAISLSLSSAADGVKIDDISGPDACAAEKASCCLREPGGCASQPSFAEPDDLA